MIPLASFEAAAVLTWAIPIATIFLVAAWLSVPHVSSATASDRDLERGLRARVRVLLQSREGWTVPAQPPAHMHRHHHHRQE